MKKIIAVMACVLLSAVLLCSCGSEEPKEETTAANDAAVVGTWTEEFFDSGFIFNADGTGTDTFWDLTFTYTAVEGNLMLIYDTELYGASNYTYSVSGNQLTMTRIDTEETDTITYTKAGTEAPAEGESSADGEAPVDGAPLGAAGPMDGEAPVDGEGDAD